MLFSHSRTLSCRKKGLILATSLIMLVLVSYTGINLYSTSLNIQRIDEYRNDGVKAFTIAEGGLHRVIHFFNHPEDYSEDDTLFFYDEPNDTFPNLVSALQTGPVVIPASYYPVFDSSGNDSELGRVTSLAILPPENADPVPCLGKIKSVGKATRLGVEKTVIAYFQPSSPSVKSLAAIISRNNTYFNGNVKVEWGEVWSIAPTEFEGFQNSKLRLYVNSSDQGWTVARTNSYFYNMTGTEQAYMDGTRDGSLAEQTGLINPYDGDPEFDGRFMQYQNLDFPEYDYEEFKTLAQKRGEYYSTDAAGNIYKDGIEDSAHKISTFEAEFGNETPQSALRLVFIDTMDGNPPAVDGSNLANLSISGSSPHFRGLLYINANFEIAGLGNPPTITAHDPNDTAHQLPKIWVDGLVYIAGTLDVTGNPRVFGSVVVEREIVGNGTPEVFYNYKLADGLSFPIGNNIEIDLMAIE